MFSSNNQPSTNKVNGEKYFNMGGPNGWACLKAATQCSIAAQVGKILAVTWGMCNCSNRHKIGRFRHAALAGSQQERCETA
jgi:hypothetical protein